MVQTLDYIKGLGIRTPQTWVLEDTVFNGQMNGLDRRLSLVVLQEKVRGGGKEGRIRTFYLVQTSNISSHRSMVQPFMTCQKIKTRKTTKKCYYIPKR